MKYRNNSPTETFPGNYSTGRKQRFMKKTVDQFLSAIAIFLLLISATANNAAAQTIVPSGNRKAVQPSIPYASAKRTRELATTYEARYQKIYALLQNDAHLRARIAATAQAYEIDPVHIAAAIIGEHTYNVDVYDQIQTYYIKGVSWANRGVVFAYRGENISDFIKRPQFEPCQKLHDSYQLWTCRENIWNKSFRQKKIDGRVYPDNRFSAVFFQPFFAGQTFGLGQINPLTALKVSDRVHKTSGLPKLDANDGSRIYRTIMDPDLTLFYIAAIIRQSIDSYRQIAGFDISQNPGLTATLYNTGGAEERARKLASANEKRKADGKPAHLPQENYYGWFINTRLDDLQKLF